jgi:hypothetical protein
VKTKENSREEKVAMAITVAAVAGKQGPGSALLRFTDPEVPYGTMVNITTGDDAEALRNWHAPERWNNIAVAVRDWVEKLRGVSFASFTMWNTGHSDEIDVELLVLPRHVTADMVAHITGIIQSHYEDVPAGS